MRVTEVNAYFPHSQEQLNVGISDDNPVAVIPLEASLNPQDKLVLVREEEKDQDVLYFAHSPRDPNAVDLGEDFIDVSLLTKLKKVNPNKQGLKRIKIRYDESMPIVAEVTLNVW